MNVLRSSFVCMFFFQAVQRGETDCPICLTSLVSTSYIQRPDKGDYSKQTNSNQSDSSKQPSRRAGNKKSLTSAKKGDPKNRKSEIKPLDVELPDTNQSCDTNHSACRQTVLLSCSHVFHETCLEMFEELNEEANKVCPVCRAKYQKKSMWNSRAYRFIVCFCLCYHQLNVLK